MLLVAIVIFLSLSPTQTLPELPFSFGDKLEHLLAYGAIMFWFGLIYRARGASLLIAACFVALGIALEFAQGATGYRTFEYRDMAANGIGVAAGFILSRSKLGQLLFVVENFLAKRSAR